MSEPATDERPVSGAPLPVGFRIEFDESAREVRRGVWFGGQPARVLKLSDSGAAALDALRSHPVRTNAEAVVARRFTDAGLAHPVPGRSRGPEVTVVVPVHDDPARLERCLASLGHAYPVVVVDDASPDELGLRAVAARHGATVVRHRANAGPGVARNTGLEHVETELVAFVDSDTEPGDAWIAELAAHLADPLVAAAAPRVVPRADDTWAGRYTRAHGTLDLGPLPARVLPYTRVSYVPSAALVARCSALAAAAREGAVFDPALRVGEDVDLVWRLIASGARIRYVPTARVQHSEPRTWPGLLRRRFRYGTSAGALAVRHPLNVAPLVVHPWYSAAAVAVLARRPVLAAAATAGAAWRTRQALHRADVPADHLAAMSTDAVAQTLLGTSRYAVQFGWPVLLAGTARGPAGRRVVATAVLLTPAVHGWVHRRSPLDPIRYTAGGLADDIAYGAGVIVGCIRHRTSTALRPRRFH